ncbi:hypothetical protein BJF93_23075 [Xaviernesmea oryzae]|uniref:DUF4942 domain-containing protein n=3 Tax=Xaviernesmea oryzae TaxID=464029 RepID=A0A1Q9AU58_9HYPH|nr:hypothetical protein BJF93_23075 [Xaviernesmea oryzae]SEM02097.1 Methyltransferase domain-containing protein [Xaviernesmea oryzae]
MVDRTILDDCVRTLRDCRTAAESATEAMLRRMPFLEVAISEREPADADHAFPRVVADTSWRRADDLPPDVCATPGGTALSHCMRSAATDQFGRKIWQLAIDKIAARSNVDRTDRAAVRLMHDSVPDLNDPAQDVETIRLLCESPGTLFRRTLARRLSVLDRRFRSYDGWRENSAAKLVHIPSHEISQQDIMRLLWDVEVIFAIMDGRESEYDANTSLAALKKAVIPEVGFANGITAEYLDVTIPSTGELSIKFRREDLLEKILDVLADHYGAPAPEEGIKDTDNLYAPTRSHAKNLGFFPTPPDIASTIIQHSSIFRRSQGDSLRVLEPSAGAGHLAREAVQAGAMVDCVELDADRCAQLRAAGLYRMIRESDFLDVNPEETGLYDRVIMNPPFDHQRDIDHVMHAIRFLKPDGLLVSVMSPGTEYRSTQKATAFRRYVADLNGYWLDLPEESFVLSGSYSNTILLNLWRDGRAYFSNTKTANFVRP